MWAFVDRVLRDPLPLLNAPAVPISARRVLVIESPIGGEVEELLRRGYTSSLIHVVNESPAVVATVQRRYRDDARMQGMLRTHGTTLDAALAELHREGVLFDAMNLDFTGCLSGSLLLTIAAASSIMKPGGAFVVTVQRGREQFGVAVPPPVPYPSGEQQDAQHHADARRVLAVALATSRGNGAVDHSGCQWHFSASKWSVYRGGNSRVTMMWVGMHLIPHAQSGLVSVWQTSDPFAPFCGFFALQRKKLPMSRQLLMQYAFVDGIGTRLFFNGTHTEVREALTELGVQQHWSAWARPQLLDKWASRRGRKRAV